MANLLPLVVSTIGNTQRLNTGDDLAVHDAIDTVTGTTLTLGAAIASATTIGKLGALTTVAGNLEVIGASTFNGNVDALSGLDITGGNGLTIDGIQIDSNGVDALLLGGTGTTKAPAFVSLTTIERDALTAINGMQIYNETLNEMHMYVDSSWVNISSGGATGGLTGTTNLSWAINTDGGITNEDAVLIFESGDGYSEFLGYWTLNADTDPPVLEYSITADGYVTDSKIGIGAAGETGLIDAEIIFNSGTGSATKQTSIFFDGLGDDLIIGRSDYTSGDGYITIRAGTTQILMPDDMASPFVITEGLNEYFSINTRDGYEGLSLCNTANNPTITQLGLGQVTFSGNVDASLGLDVTGGDFTATGGVIDLDPDGYFTLDMADGQSAIITIDNSLVGAFLIQEGLDPYFLIDTMDGQRAIKFGNINDNPVYNFLGTGEATFGDDIAISGVIYRLDNDGNGIIIGHSPISGATGSAPQMVSLTTTERDYLVGTDGMIVYNESIDEMQMHVNGAWEDIGGGGAANTGTTNLTWTINSDGEAINEDAALILVSSDGYSRFDGYWTLNVDLDPPTLEYSVTDNDVPDFPRVGIGAAGETANLSATLFFNSGNGGSANQASILLTGGNVLELGTGATSVSSTVNFDALAGADITGDNLTLNGSGINILFSDTDGTSHSISCSQSINIASSSLTISAGQGADSDSSIGRNGGACNLVGGAGGDGAASYTPGSGAVVTIRGGAGGAYIDTGGGDGGGVNIVGGASDGGGTGVHGSVNIGNLNTVGIGLGNATDDTTITQVGVGQVTFTGNVDATNGLDVSVAALTMTGTDIDLDPTGNFTLDMDNNQTVTITIDDGYSAFLIQTGSGTYLDIDSAVGVEAIYFGSDTINPDYEFNGAGDVNISNGTANLPSGTNLYLSDIACTAGVTATNLNTLTDTSNADALHTHTGLGASSQVVATGLTTTGLSNGYFGYISSANTLSKCDADTEVSSRVFGANEGTVGSMTIYGIIDAAIFTTIGGSPGNGDPIYLAAGTEEGSAEGKATATAPTGAVSGAGAGDFVAEIGICVDNSNYAGSKTCKILLQPKLMIIL